MSGKSSFNLQEGSVFQPALFRQRLRVKIKGQVSTFDILGVVC